MQEHLSDALAGLLYKWPLFAYGNAEDQDIRVMIVAEKSNILKQAINAVYRTIDDNSARAASLYFGYCRPV